MERLDVVGMLGKSCSTMEVGVMKSVTMHEWEGAGCFCRVQFGKKMVIEY